ncbi:hypothetical protein [Intestinibacter sp.]|uniref:hypothetical protein n=1 Tax=Intestinibacter sp. TaxID=1965304 RepID=UPI003F18C4F1
MKQQEKTVSAVNIVINIQSFSDIITNSSSELFCTVSGNENVILFINNLLSSLFKDDEYYSEDTPTYHLLCKSDLDKEEFSEKQWKELPEYSIQINLPYSLGACETFFMEGLKALLENSEVKGKYKLDFNG